MGRTNKSRREAWERQEQAAGEAFYRRAAAVKTYAEADALADQGPGPSQPGRKYYSNLGFFLSQFMVPAGSSFSERNLYIELIEKFDAAGNLKPGVAQRVIAELKASMGNAPYL